LIAVFIFLFSSLKTAFNTLGQILATNFTKAAEGDNPVPFSLLLLLTKLILPAPCRRNIKTRDSRTSLSMANI